ncbi:hypothetical protein [Streptomyces sp. Sge12]|uniref:hypothetical protein n=1 Tax=Streptomyces sp. Sge12 TaxID=1972846 RepID=UPI001331BF43|nr:hypothetical protein [Streptomyces sp. Sge12]
MDVNTFSVALVGTEGTVCGTLSGVVLSQRAGRAQAAEQNRRADREREEGRAERALQAKRGPYAHLNTTARAYRVAAREAVEAAERRESVDAALLDTAREAWAEQYSCK